MWSFHLSSSLCAQSCTVISERLDGFLLISRRLSVQGIEWYIKLLFEHKEHVFNIKLVIIVKQDMMAKILLFNLAHYWQLDKNVTRYSYCIIMTNSVITYVVSN